MVYYDDDEPLFDAPFRKKNSRPGGLISKGNVQLLASCGVSDEDMATLWKIDVSELIEKYSGSLKKGREKPKASTVAIQETLDTITDEQIRKLSGAGHTLKEISAIYHLPENVVMREFGKIHEEGKGDFYSKIRQAQEKLLDQGNVQMIIHLGKTELKQSPAPTRIESKSSKTHTKSVQLSFDGNPVPSNDIKKINAPRTFDMEEEIISDEI